MICRLFGVLTTAWGREAPRQELGVGGAAKHSWAQSAMDRWSIPILSIDTTVLVMLTHDSIDPSVKYFFFLIDSIDHRSQNPCQTNDHRSIGSLSTDGIDPSVKNQFHCHHFSE
jgi:hypothetical protein